MDKEKKAGKMSTGRDIPAETQGNDWSLCLLDGHGPEKAMHKKQREGIAASSKFRIEHQFTQQNRIIFLLCSRKFKNNSISMEIYLKPSFLANRNKTSLQLTKSSIEKGPALAD